MHLIYQYLLPYLHIDVLSAGMIALHYATWQGLAQPVQMLLHSGSPVNEQALSGETPLHLAAQHGHYDVVGVFMNILWIKS